MLRRTSIVEATIVLILLLVGNSLPAAEYSIRVDPLMLELPTRPVAAWLDGEKSQTLEIPRDGKKHSVAFVTHSGKFYGAWLRVAEGSSTGTSPRFEFGGADVQSEAFIHRRLLRPASRVKVIGDVVLVWDQLGIQMLNAFDFSPLRRNIDSSKIVVAPNPATCFLEWSLMPSGSGVGQSAIFRQTAFSESALQFIPGSEWFSAPSAIPADSNPSGSCVAIAPGPTLFNFEGHSETRRIKIGSPREALKRASWTSTVISSTEAIAKSVDSKTVYGVSMAEGGIGWNLSTDSRVEKLLGCGDVFVLSLANKSLMAIRGTDGLVLWRLKLSSRIRGELVCSNSKVYYLEGNLLASVEAASGKVYAVDLKVRGLGNAKSLRALETGDLLIQSGSNNFLLLDAEHLLPLVAATSVGVIKDASAGNGLLFILNDEAELFSFAVRGSRKVKFSFIGTVFDRDVQLLPNNWLVDGEVGAGGHAPLNSCVEKRSEAQISSGRNVFVVPSGTLEIKVGPSDSYIWMDGRFIASKSPVRIEIQDGEHRIVAAHPDRRSSSVLVEAGGSNVNDVKIELSSFREGTLGIYPNERGAKIFMDGELKGLSPLSGPIYTLDAHRIVNLDVRKLGYETYSHQLQLIEGDLAVSPDLKFALLPAEIVFLARPEESTILGWPNESILKGTTVGQPIRTRGSTEAAFLMELSVPLARFDFFVRGIVSDSLLEGTGGFRYELSRDPRRSSLMIGMVYSVQSGFPESGADCPPRGFGPAFNCPIPLEAIEHPIENVKINATDRSFGGVQLRYRPGARWIFTVEHATPLTARLHGVALEDAAGSLAESGRFYRYEVEGGQRTSLAIRYFIPGFRHLDKHDFAFSLMAGYSETEIDFGVAQERSSGVFWGLGLSFFEGSRNVRQ